MITQINEERFDKEIQTGGNTLFVFGAPWCPDCRKIEPILDVLATEYQGKVNIFKVDTSENETLKEKLDIRRIPTLIFYKKGQEIGERLVEPNNKMAIAKAIDALLEA